MQRVERRFDVQAATHVVEMLGGEIDPSLIVHRWLSLCREHAGAHRGALVLDESGTLVVVARLEGEDGRVVSGLSEPLSSCRDVPGSVVRHAARGMEIVCIGDPSRDERFRGDPHFAVRAPRAILALPLRGQGNAAFVLYLEQHDDVSAFSPSRLEALSFIALEATRSLAQAKRCRDLEERLRDLAARHEQLLLENAELRRRINPQPHGLIERLLENAPRQSSVSLPVDALLGDEYRVVRRLGEGGMGAVYEVERLIDGVRFAAKVLSHARKPLDVERFAREAQLMASVSHPNVVSIVDAGVTADGVYFMVVELVDGTSLREVDVRNHDIAWILSVLGQVAEALSALAEKGIVHRDLKPENVLLVSSRSSSALIVKIADFGISYIADEPRRNAGDTSSGVRPLGITLATPTDTRTSQLSSVPGFGESGGVIGTPSYMAPELHAGSRSAGPPSDVWSLGAIAFEMLVGSRPFAFPPVMLGGEVQDVVVPTSLRDCPGLPAELASLFERSLAMSPDERPTAEEVASALRQHADLRAGS